MPKITKEKFKTEHNVFDESTKRVLHKLESEGHFDYLESPLKIGKEANVFSAKNDEGHVAVKIYRVNNCDFNRMYDYIKTDVRYVGLKGKRRAIINHWVQREYRNLMNAREVGIRVPTPIAFSQNVIVMSLIGTKDELAHQIKDDIPEDLQATFDAIVEDVKKLYKIGLVHADLSQFNILNYKQKPYLIDFSQCTSVKDPNAQSYLERDVRNIVNFFKKQGLKVTEEDMLKKIKS